jgi:nucleoside-diphosphate-sugar epimerase
VTVVVTGGAGLVGSHAIAALVARGEPVRALVRPGAAPAVRALGAEPVPGDTRDPGAWRTAIAAPGGVRAIVHAAALVTRRVSLDEFLAVNVGGTEQAVAAARAAGARLVHISSVAVYGRRATYAAGPGAVDEDFPFHPLEAADYYARSKRVAEERLWAAAAAGRVWAVALRPNVIYGERDRTFTPRVARFVRLGIVPRIGAGTNRLSCVYAGNVAAAAMAALDAPVPGGRPYNVTNDDGLTQRELVAAFAEDLGVRVRAVPVPYVVAAVAVRALGAARRLTRPGIYRGVAGAAVEFLAAENPFRSERARRELGWVPPVAPREAVRRTVRWLSEHETPGR